MSQGSFYFEKEVVSFIDGDVLYFPNFFTSSYFELLRNELSWQSDKINLFGKSHFIPRLHCWYADSDIHYEYSGIKLRHNSWTNSLLEIKKLVEISTSHQFNGMLGNLYRSGSDYVSWHSDDEPSLGADPIIACASFGESRVFSLRNKRSKEVVRVNLEDRSLLVMLPPTQKEWDHQINKSKKLNGERISLTFRQIYQ